MANKSGRRFPLVFAAHLGLFYAAAIWGATFFIVKDALADIDPISLVGYRFALAAVLMAPALIIQRRFLFDKLSHGIWLGLLLTILYAAQTIGLKFTTASNSGFITGLFVAFVPICAYAIFGQKPTPASLLAIAISLVGLWLLTGGVRKPNPGDMLTIVAALAYALHILFADGYLKAGLDPVLLSFQQFATVGLLALAVAIGISPSTISISLPATKVVVFLALLPTLSAFVIQLFAQRLVPPVRVSLIFALEPVFAAVFAWTLGGEKVVASKAIGGLFVFLAMVISGLPSLSARRA